MTAATFKGETKGSQLSTDKADNEGTDESVLPLENEAEAEETEEIEESEAGEAEKNVEPNEDEIIVTLGEDAPPADEEEEAKKPGVLNDLRKRYRELERENRQLREQSQTQVQVKPPELGKKPTLEEADYDAEEFENRLATWYEQKRRVDEEAAAKRAEQEASNQAFNQRVATFVEKKTKLQSRVKDFDEAEHEVLKDFDKTQIGILVDCADDSALLAYALGKNSVKRKELASIKNLPKFCYALGKLDTQLKITPKKSVPQAESRVKRGSASTSGVVDSTLKRLREDAEKTGNYTKILEYRQSMRTK